MIDGILVNKKKYYISIVLIIISYVSTYIFLTSSTPLGKVYIAIPELLWKYVFLTGLIPLIYTISWLSDERKTIYGIDKTSWDGKKTLTFIAYLLIQATTDLIGGVYFGFRQCGMAYGLTGIYLMVTWNILLGFGIIWFWDGKFRVVRIYCLLIFSLFINDVGQGYGFLYYLGMPQQDFISNFIGGVLGKC